MLAYNDTPMISGLAPLEKNPQIIMWDPETYPEAETLADLGELGVTINVFGGGVFSDVFVAQGIWSADQVDPSYDGSPQRFVAAGGAIAQQGFASAEPYNYEFVFEEWGKPVAYELLHDAGFEVYSQTIAVRPDKFDELSPCLEQIVPIMQQATVDFTESPDRANGIIIDAVEQFADFWVYDEGVAEYSVNTMKELGLKSNGPDDTLGNMEEDRIQGVIDAIRDAGLDVPEDLVASDLFTNEFIDDSIGIPSTTEPASTSTQPTATTAPATTAPATTAPATTIPEGPFVELAVSSGTSTRFLVTSCINPGETTIRIEAETINTDATVLMTMDVESGTGSIVLSGAEEAEGTVDQIMVSDTGDITASGTISAAGGSGQDTFDLTGNCA